ncbi:MAG: PEP-CTERM sorting domain-containing protein [Sedimentisphaerales bacterium]|nr:PEP-CTERM sorting domain-containing protein [Sedimentisphaerales bacterium]
MRKSLVLIMVLALATSAHAALTMSLSSSTVAVDNTVTANIILSDASWWDGFFVLSEDPYNWADPVAARIIDYGPRDPFIEQDPEYPGVLHLTNVFMEPPPQPGIQFWILIEGVQPGTIYLSLQDPSSYEEISSNGPLTLEVIVPEPMTITLLALGGLLLRRRNRKI